MISGRYLGVDVVSCAIESVNTMEKIKQAAIIPLTIVCFLQMSIAKRINSYENGKGICEIRKIKKQLHQIGRAFLPDAI